MNRYKRVKHASILGIIGNIFLLIIKGFIGIVSNSQAMIADAFNSASDSLSSLFTYIGNKIASVPADDDHNLGHGKAEYIFSNVISIIMIIAGVIILKNSIFSIFSCEKYDFSIWLVIICIVTIIVKLFLYLYTKRIAKEHNNLLMKANSLDHRNDCVITTFTLLSSLLAYNEIYFIDGIVGSLISIWIIFTAVKIFMESYDVLMDKSISLETRKKVFDIIEKHDEIIKINHFNSTPVGYKYQISLTIFVDGNLSTFESHDIADKLEKEITKNIEEIYLAVIHVNPIDIENN